MFDSANLSFGCTTGFYLNIQYKQNSKLIRMRKSGIAVHVSECMNEWVSEFESVNICVMITSSASCSHSTYVRRNVPEVRHFQIQGAVSSGIKGCANDSCDQISGSQVTL